MGFRTLCTIQQSAGTASIPAAPAAALKHAAHLSNRQADAPAAGGTRREPACVAPEAEAMGARVKEEIAYGARRVAQYLR